MRLVRSAITAAAEVVAEAVPQPPTAEERLLSAIQTVVDAYAAGLPTPRVRAMLREDLHAAADRFLDSKLVAARK